MCLGIYGLYTKAIHVQNVKLVNFYLPLTYSFKKKKHIFQIGELQEKYCQFDYI